MLQTIRSARVRVVAGALALVASGLVPAVAHAHAELVQADPAPGAVPGLPGQLTLTYSQQLDRGTEVQLLDPSGAPLPGVSSAIDRSRLTRLVVSLPSAGAGAYTVAWTSISAEDGHENKGFFGLLAGAPSPLAISDPQAGPPTSGPGDVAVQLSVAPDDQGVHRWAASVVGADPSAISRVLFRFTPKMADLGTENLVATWDAGSGTYTVAEPVALAGPWQVEVGVRRDSVPDDVRVPFSFTAS
jgi:copper resistance protein C